MRTTNIDIAMNVACHIYMNVNEIAIFKLLLIN